MSLTQVPQSSLLQVVLPRHRPRPGFELRFTVVGSGGMPGLL